VYEAWSETLSDYTRRELTRLRISLLLLEAWRSKLKAYGKLIMWAGSLGLIYQKRYCGGFRILRPIILSIQEITEWLPGVGCAWMAVFSSIQTCDVCTAQDIHKALVDDRIEFGQLKFP
jgi:hypothetical protein